MQYDTTTGVAWRGVPRRMQKYHFAYRIRCVFDFARKPASDCNLCGCNRNEKKSVCFSDQKICQNFMNKVCFWKNFHPGHVSIVYNFLFNCLLLVKSFVIVSHKLIENDE